MSHPAVTVIMPVYNAEDYLQQAIESILKQTFDNFEFVIINDNSTDGSGDIIEGFKDERIKYIKQPENKGVVTAMNKGLKVALAPFVAVMHADDISVANRLELEYNYLQHNPDCAVVAGKTIFIDEAGRETGEFWKLDNEKISPSTIKKTMIRENCITHSTVMYRTEVARKYRYQSSPKHEGYAVEDYPLWLNILSDGYEIHKLLEKVLYYRTHKASATTTFLRRSNPFLVNYYSKKFYLELRRKNDSLNSFDKQVRISMYIDYVKAILKNAKRGLIG